jgi:hypothetical protein
MASRERATGVAEVQVLSPQVVALCVCRRSGPVSQNDKMTLDMQGVGEDAPGPCACDLGYRRGSAVLPRLAHSGHFPSSVNQFGYPCPAGNRTCIVR